MDVVIEQFTIYLVRLDPTVGREMKKIRPCLVISPDELNRHLQTALVAPLTTAEKEFVSRVSCAFAGKRGQIALGQIRCADHARFIKRLGRLEMTTCLEVLETLQAMFR